MLAMLHVLFIFSLVICRLHCQHEDTTGQESEGGGEAWDEDELDGRMWMGNITSYEKHPYFASVAEKKGLILYNYKALCGGAFITPQMVLTAAHCIHGKEAGDIRIRYGSNEAGTTSGDRNEFGVGIDRKVSGIYTHPFYKEARYNFTEVPDVGLVRL